jgi:hypothetical protein
MGLICSMQASYGVEVESDAIDTGFVDFTLDEYNIAGPIIIYAFLQQQ